MRIYVFGQATKHTLSIHLAQPSTQPMFQTFMRTQPNNKKRAHSILKAWTERRKESLPYILGVAYFCRRGGTKLKQPPPVMQPLTSHPPRKPPKRAW
jgi:hypothetical protein